MNTDRHPQRDAANRFGIDAASRRGGAHLDAADAAWSGWSSPSKSNKQSVAAEFQQRAAARVREVEHLAEDAAQYLGQFLGADSALAGQALRELRDPNVDENERRVENSELRTRRVEGPLGSDAGHVTRQPFRRSPRSPPWTQATATTSVRRRRAKLTIASNSASVRGKPREAVALSPAAGFREFGECLSSASSDTNGRARTGATVTQSQRGSSGLLAAS